MNTACDTPGTPNTHPVIAHAPSLLPKLTVNVLVKNGSGTNIAYTRKKEIKSLNFKSKRVPTCFKITDAFPP